MAEPQWLPPPQWPLKALASPRAAYSPCLRITGWGGVVKNALPGRILVFRVRTLKKETARGTVFRGCSPRPLSGSDNGPSLAACAVHWEQCGRARGSQRFCALRCQVHSQLPLTTFPGSACASAAPVCSHRERTARTLAKWFLAQVWKKGQLRHRGRGPVPSRI